MSDFLKRIAGFSPKRLLLLAVELEERVRALEARQHAPIAIVGMACRLPGGVSDAEGFWDLLREGRDAITEAPRERWDVERLYNPDPLVKGKLASKWGGFIDDVTMFDAGFFGIAPVEAVNIDPQQRLLLEVTWEALEDAGIVPASLNGSKTGVYVGICNTDYGQMALRRPFEELDAYSATGAAHAVASGRISYFLGLRGPSMAIDTACSASLVCVHEACQSLRLGESDLALAGGVNLVLTPDVTIGMSRGQLMAKDGRCKSFDARADGYVRSEGCGMMVLKLLEDAERDGDRILGVLRGSAVNQDGRSSGLTAPNGPSQEDVIRTALKDAGVSADAISYVEAHGTGTSLGDTIEMQALGEVLGRGRTDAARLAVGSVKSNIGHLESAAGIAGLMKVVLAMEHEALPPSLHCRQPNPAIDWERHRTRVPVVLEPWKREAEKPRIAGVSSFGFSGTNSHVILAEAPAAKAREDVAGSQLIVLSARSARSLRAAASRLAKQLHAHPEMRLVDVAFTLAAGRTAFAYRAALRVASREELMDELELLAAQDASCRFVQGSANGIGNTAFLFAGQGGERTGMGLSLLGSSKAFRDAVAEVDAALQGHADVPPIETIWRNEAEELAQSANVQPALFAFQYGLAKVWQSWGIEPAIVLGHSMGELVAAALAGVMRVEDAVRLIAARGRLTGDLGDAGGMVAINAGEAQVQAVLRAYAADVSIAAVNGTASVVISGRADAVEQATREFEQAGVRVKRLNITYGSHSPAMDRVVPAFYAEAAKVTYAAPSLPIVADMTGAMVEDASVLDARYWSEHLRRPVQFARCLERLEQENCGLAIEMGPRAVLTSFGRERNDVDTRWVASADGRTDDFDALLQALGEAFVAGATIDWKAVYADRGLEGATDRVSLPAYPFERERYWIDLPQEARTQARQRGVDAECAAGARLDAALPLFERAIGAGAAGEVVAYRMGALAAAPAALPVIWAKAAYSQGMPEATLVSMRKLHLHAVLQAGETRTRVQTCLFPAQDAWTQVRISAEELGGWTQYADVEIAAGKEQSDDRAETVTRWRQDLDMRRSGEEFYAGVAAQGIQLNELYRGVQEIWVEPGKATGHLLTAQAAEQEAMVLLESAFHVLAAAASVGESAVLRMVSSAEEIVLTDAFRGELWAHAQMDDTNGGTVGSVAVVDAAGERVAWARGVVLRAVEIPSTAPVAAEIVKEAVTGWPTEPGESRAQALERAVRLEAARVLGMRRGLLPDSEARLADLGMDSLMAVTLRNRLQTMVGHGLPATFAFEYPTAAEMAAALDLLLWTSGEMNESVATAERDEISI